MGLDSKNLSEAAESGTINLVKQQLLVRCLKQIEPFDEQEKEEFNTDLESTFGADKYFLLSTIIYWSKRASFDYELLIKELFESNCALSLDLLFDSVRQYLDGISYPEFSVEGLGLSTFTNMVLDQEACQLLDNGLNDPFEKSRDIQSVISEYTARLKRMKESGSAIAEVFNEMYRDEGGYRSGSSLMMNLYMKGRGNCESRAKRYGCLVSEVFKEEIESGEMDVYFSFVYRKDRVPHMMTIVAVDDEMYVLDEGVEVFKRSELESRITLYDAETILMSSYLIGKKEMYISFDEEGGDHSHLKQVSSDSTLYFPASEYFGDDEESVEDARGRFASVVEELMDKAQTPLDFIVGLFKFPEWKRLMPVLGLTVFSMIYALAESGAIEEPDDLKLDSELSETELVKFEFPEVKTAISDKDFAIKPILDPEEVYEPIDPEEEKEKEKVVMVMDNNYVEGMNTPSELGAVVNFREIIRYYQDIAPKYIGSTPKKFKVANSDYSRHEKILYCDKNLSEYSFPLMVSGYFESTLDGFNNHYLLVEEQNGVERDIVVVMGSAGFLDEKTYNFLEESLVRVVERDSSPDDEIKITFLVDSVSRVEIDENKLHNRMIILGQKLNAKIRLIDEKDRSELVAGAWGNTKEFSELEKKTLDAYLGSF